jgi:hypothetical protein
MVWLFVLGVAIQFFLAGLGVLGGEDIEPHEALGSLLTLVSLILLLLAYFGKQDKPIIGMCAVLLILGILQSVWVNIDDPQFLQAFHVFDALLIAGIAQHLAQRVGWLTAARA